MSLLQLFTAVRVVVADSRERLAAEHGEGVISAAIAVLVMAFLGAAMWFTFSALFEDTSGAISDQVGNIGG